MQCIYVYWWYWRYKSTFDGITFSKWKYLLDLLVAKVTRENQFLDCKTSPNQNVSTLMYRYVNRQLWAFLRWKCSQFRNFVFTYKNSYKMHLWSGVFIFVLLLVEVTLPVFFGPFVWYSGHIINSMEWRDVTSFSSAPHIDTSVDEKLAYKMHTKCKVFHVT